MNVTIFYVVIHFCLSLLIILPLIWVHWFSVYHFFPLWLSLGKRAVHRRLLCCCYCCVSASAWFTMEKAIPAGRLKAISCLPHWPETTGYFHGLHAAGNISKNSLGKTSHSQGCSQVWSGAGKQYLIDVKTNMHWKYLLTSQWTEKLTNSDEDDGGGDDDIVIIVIVEKTDWRPNIVLNALHIITQSVLTAVLLFPHSRVEEIEA